MNEPLKENEYRCACCHEVFELVNDEQWDDEKAKAESKQLFGVDPTPENSDVVCDDCFKKMGF